MPLFEQTYKHGLENGLLESAFYAPVKKRQELICQKPLYKMITRSPCQLARSTCADFIGMNVQSYLVCYPEKKAEHAIATTYVRTYVHNPNNNLLGREFFSG